MGTEETGFDPEAEPTPLSPASLTPVGDYLAKRYPPNPGATHWMGHDGDPGCCAGAHPSCLYDVAWREALRSFAADLDELARDCKPHPQATPAQARYGQGTLQAAAELARAKMEASP